VDAPGINVSSLLFAGVKHGNSSVDELVARGLERRFEAWRLQQLHDCAAVLPLAAYATEGVYSPGADTDADATGGSGRQAGPLPVVADSLTAVIRPVKGDHIHVALSVFVNGRRLATPRDMPQVGLREAAGGAAGGSSIHVSSVRPHVGIHSGNNPSDGDDGLIHVHPGSAWAWLRGPTEGLGATLGVLLEVVGLSVWDRHSPRYPQHVPLAAMESTWRSAGTKWGQAPAASSAAAAGTGAGSQAATPGDGCLEWGACLDASGPLLYHPTAASASEGAAAAAGAEAVPSQYSGYSTSEYDLGHTILCSNASHVWRLYVWRHYSELCDTWLPVASEGDGDSSERPLASPVRSCSSEDGEPSMVEEAGLERLHLGALPDGVVALSFEARELHPKLARAGYFATPPVVVQPADAAPSPADMRLREAAGRPGSSSRWPVPLQRTVDALHAQSIPVGFDGGLYPAPSDRVAFPFLSPRWLRLLRNASSTNQPKDSYDWPALAAVQADVANHVDAFGSFVCPSRHAGGIRTLEARGAAGLA